MLATSDHRGSIALQRTLADATSCDQLQDEEQGHMQFASVQSGNLVNDTDRKAVKYTPVCPFMSKNSL